MMPLCSNGSSSGGRERKCGMEIGFGCKRKVTKFKEEQIGDTRPSDPLHENNHSQDKMINLQREQRLLPFGSGYRAYLWISPPTQPKTAASRWYSWHFLQADAAALQIRKPAGIQPLQGLMSYMRSTCSEMRIVICNAGLMEFRHDFDITGTKVQHT